MSEPTCETPNGITPPIFGSTEVTRDLYLHCSFLVMANDLQKKGLLEGGPLINEPAMRGIVYLGEQAGYAPASDIELRELANHYRDGGDWLAEACGEHQPREKETDNG
jgi:hypothetical protein